jgi:hypothetical protein
MKKRDKEDICVKCGRVSARASRLRESPPCPPSPFQSLVENALSSSMCSSILFTPPAACGYLCNSQIHEYLGVHCFCPHMSAVSYFRSKISRCEEPRISTNFTCRIYVVISCLNQWRWPKSTGQSRLPITRRRSGQDE